MQEKTDNFFPNPGVFYTKRVGLEVKIHYGQNRFHRKLLFLNTDGDIPSFFVKKKENCETFSKFRV